MNRLSEHEIIIIANRSPWLKKGEDVFYRPLQKVQRVGEMPNGDKYSYWELVQLFNYEDYPSAWGFESFDDAERAALRWIDEQEALRDD